MTQSRESDSEQGWFFPTGARKCHWDRGDFTALCGKWMRRHPFGGGTAPIVSTSKAISPDDCAGCRKKLDVEEGIR